MTTLTNEILQLSGRERFIAAANYKHANFYIAIQDIVGLGLNENAELIDVEPYSVPPYTGRAVFRMDRQANALPLGEVANQKRYFNRYILIKQITGQEIVDQFGIAGTVYLNLGENVPATTKELAATFDSMFGLKMVEADIVDQIIPTGARCIVLRFAPKSVGFKGGLRVDLTTQVLPSPEPAFQ